MRPYVLGFSGYSGSGKTTLIEGLIPLLKEQGLKVAVIKHDGHEFLMDHEGKDTYRFTKAGADSVMISSKTRSAGIFEYPQALDEMIKRCTSADIVLVEGYKDAEIPRIGVASERTTHELPLEIDKYKAVADDDLSGYRKDENIRLFGLDDHKAIAEWIMGEMENKDRAFTHFDDEGNARMVDVSDKEITVRTARASAKVLVNEKTFELIKSGNVKKGDVLTVARIAGIMGAKKTPELIPMCHPVITDKCEVRLWLNEEERCVEIESLVKCTGRTGVEMEAICACSVAAMTVYDMCKSVQRDIVLTEIRLKSKTGGVHGDYEYKG